MCEGEMAAVGGEVWWKQEKDRRQYEMRRRAMREEREALWTIEPNTVLQ